MILRLLLHNRIIVRFFALYVLGVILFMATWFISYHVMPEGGMSGFSIASKLAGNQSAPHVLTEWLRIIGINLFPLLLVVIANLFFLKNTFPRGYLIPLEWFIYYGLLLGTNSFSIPLDQPMAPSLIVLGRSGLYEIGAYTLIAVATYSISRYRLKGFFSRTERYTVKHRQLSLEDKAGFIIAIIILLAANLREAIMIVTP